METTWILIGNASRARLFSSTSKQQPWILVKEFDHPRSRLKGSEIMADKPGRVQQISGRGSRPGMEPATPPKEVEAVHFAQELANALEAGHGRHAYGRLVLVAPPPFLGLLRKAISAQVSKRVVASVDKDLTEVRDDELAGRVDELV